MYSSDAARNVPTPSPLTTLLRRICYSLFLSIRACDPTTENMSFCSLVEKTNNSLLKNRCRFPSLQTADVWGGRMNSHGFKNPRLFALSGIASFRRLYLFTERRKRLEDANRQRRLFKRYSLNAHCSQFISQNLWSSVSSVCQSLSPTRSPLYVKYFYFCPSNHTWFQNEQKPLKIFQKQT